MVELRVCPVGGVMALLAGLWEVRSRVIGIGRALKVLQVARYAGVGRQVKVVINVAVRASSWRHRVRPGERESGAVVVKRCIRPTTSVVALVAGLREIRRDVIRVGCALEVLQVAGDAGGAVQRVVVVDVAIGALARRNGVQSGQHEAGRRMIELGIAPLHRIVTGFACVWEPVVRHRSGRAGEILLVTTEARHRTQGVIVVDMAVGALPRRIRVSP